MIKDGELGKENWQLDFTVISEKSFQWVLNIFEVDQNFYAMGPHS